MRSENMKHNRLPLCVGTHTRLWLILFRSTACSDNEKNATALDCRDESSLHRARIMTKLGGCTCSTERRGLAAKFEGCRRSVSRRLAWDVGA